MKPRTIKSSLLSLLLITIPCSGMEKSNNDNATKTLRLWTNLNSMELTRPLVRDGEIVIKSALLQSNKLRIFNYTTITHPVISVKAPGYCPENIIITFTKHNHLDIKIIYMSETDSTVFIKKNDNIYAILAATITMPAFKIGAKKIALPLSDQFFNQNTSLKKLHILNKNISKIIIPEERQYSLYNNNTRQSENCFFSQMITHYRVFPNSQKKIPVISNHNEDYILKLIIPKTIEETILLYLDGITIKSDDTITLELDKKENTIVLTNQHGTHLGQIRTHKHTDNTLIIT